jgi:hypothetical protein
MLLTEALESWDNLDDERGWYPAEAVATELRAAFVDPDGPLAEAAAPPLRAEATPRRPPTVHIPDQAVG